MKKAAAVVTAALADARNRQGKSDSAISGMPHIKVRDGSRMYQGDIDISEWTPSFEAVKEMGLAQKNGPFQLTPDGERVGKAILAGHLDGVEVKFEPSVVEIREAPYFNSFIARAKELWRDSPRHVYKLAVMA